MTAMRIIHPESVVRRKKHKLIRRHYVNPGPNFMWHIDSNDKLKPYGFAIHGCIDGFSRRILWLEVGPSNKNPYIIASYYLNCLRRLKVTPKIIRANLGTENQVVSFLQTYFRFSEAIVEMARKALFLAKVVIIKELSSGGDLRDSGKYDESDPLHCDCLRFCFTRLLRKGLNNIASEWNQHRLQVRKQREYDCAQGIPDILYFLPEASNTESFGTAVNDDDINTCYEMYVRELPNLYGCSEKLLEIVNIIKPNYTHPENTEQALSLFMELIRILNEQL
ncbi:unnamed protein product [Mytilus coruscus]|uniref:Integrase core domain-containing protein n=1 Tax=Mytilus coruscus TaxID=42192 RepID=A0A6J8CWV5_MYTCO|nr:unnamed protein product [Mytilus coruscus]